MHCALGECTAGPGAWLALCTRGVHQNEREFRGAGTEGIASYPSEAAPDPPSRQLAAAKVGTPKSKQGNLHQSYSDLGKAEWASQGS